MAQTALTPKPILEQETQKPPMPKTRLMQTILEANKTTSANQTPPPQDKLSYQKPNSEVHSPLPVHLEPQSNKPKYLATTKPLRAVRYLNLSTVHQGTYTQPKDQETRNGLVESTKFLLHQHYHLPPIRPFNLIRPSKTPSNYNYRPLNTFNLFSKPGLTRNLLRFPIFAFSNSRQLLYFILPRIPVRPVNLSQPFRLSSFLHTRSSSIFNPHSNPGLIRNFLQFPNVSHLKNSHLSQFCYGRTYLRPFNRFQLSSPFIPILYSKRIFDLNYSHLMRYFHRSSNHATSPLRAVTPITIATINIYHRLLSDAAPLLSQQERPIDIVCVQEVSKRRGNREIVLDDSNQNELSLFNQTNDIEATAAFMNKDVGIIILSNMVEIRSHEILPCIVTVQLTTSAPICNEITRSDQLTIISVYAPANSRERKTFFQTTLKNKIEEVGALDEPVIMMGDFNDFKFSGLDRWPAFDRNPKNGNCLAYLGGARHWATFLSEILNINNLRDAFRLLYPEEKVFSRWHTDTEGNVVSATRIDHAIISDHLVLSLNDARYTATGFSDHHAMFFYINGQDNPTNRNTQHTRDEPEEELVGPGFWKLYPGALTERPFCARIQSLAEQLSNSLTTQRPFTITTWQEYKIRLRCLARELSSKTGWLRKQPGRKMTEIQMQIDRLDIEDDNDCARLPILLQEYRKNHRLLILDDKRRFGQTRPTSIFKPNKKRIGRHQFIILLRSEGRDEPQRTLLAKKTLIREFYETLFTPQNEFDSKLADSLLAYVPNDALLNADEIANLRMPFTNTQLLDALARCQPNSAPGVDGLPFEF